MTDSPDKCLVSLNPVNGDALGYVDTTSNSAIHAAVRTAHEAQKPWANFSISERAKLLQQGAEALLDNMESLAALLSEETGRPLRSTLQEVRGIATGVERRTEDVVSALTIESYRGESVQSEVHRLPLGVAAVIAPADHPIAMIHRMLIPALVAGNSVLLKPAPETPLVGQKITEYYQHFLPDGVLQLVQGGEQQGKMLVAANVQLIVFTGSTRTGKHIMANAAFGLKRLVMSLSGKDTLIVLDDADIDAAAQYAVQSGFGNGGQSCVATERILIDQSIADSFEQKITDLAKRYRIGSWDDPNTDIGPMINSRRRQVVLEQIDEAVTKGARVLCGNDSHPPFFVRPTVISNVTEEMQIFHRETQGPVLCTTRFDDIDTAVALANQSSLALGAVVFGSTPKAQQLAHRLEAGMIGINKSVFGVGDIPWVGAKQSGYGYHGSADGYRQFTQARIISQPAT